MARVNGDGAIPARVMFVGERPGFDENLAGRPFVGKSGQELNRFLNGYDLPLREDVYITNLVKDYAEGNLDPTPDEISRDAYDLALELQMVRPEIIVTLGRFSTRHFLGDVDMETVHGIPHEREWDGDDGVPEYRAIIFPCFHPAAALHSPDLQSMLTYDMTRLSLLLKGRLPIFEPDRVQERYMILTGEEVPCAFDQR